uniref:protein YgfX n=1 Tax=Marinobacterium profundum TaxID=1714300 RepID=UPI00082BB6F9|nr:protein YgfX [Marinobacterium profundum]
MFSPLEVTLKPSRRLWWLQLSSHLALVVLLVISVLPFYLILCLIGVAGLNLWLSYRQRRGAIRALRWDADLHTVAIYEAGQGWVSADALESVLAWRWLLILRIQAGGRRRRLVLLPDSMTRDAFRRLSVVAKLAPLQLSAPDQATRS